jgi:hypothetical protein
MPTFKELAKIVKHTPIEQAILLEGIHGIGKSEWIKQKLQEEGYRTEMKFAGQMADAGDFIGLPNRTEKIVNGVSHTVTTFAPPDWWPLDENEKVAIILDEVNRGKPEINQCLMDMVLNRKLNGRTLPKGTRIFGAVNPLTSEGTYQVEDMDPAFLDRWNRYVVNPSSDEWCDWAVRYGKISNLVISFITRNAHELDPPTEGELVSGKVYPSRRSWERVSKFLEGVVTEDGKVDKDLLGNYMMGVVGVGATSAFLQHLKMYGTGVHAGKVLTGWDDRIQVEIEKLNIQEVIHMNRQMNMWFEKEEDAIMNGDKIAIECAKNLQSYLNVIPAEAMADFFDHVSIANNEGKMWPGSLMNLNSNLADRFIDVINGSEEEEESSNW